MAEADVVVKCEDFLETEMQTEENYLNFYGTGEAAVGNENWGRNENDDRKLKELLHEFDLEILFTVLKVGDITYRSLKYISENDINAVIRSISYRAEFREKLFAWRRDKYGLNDFSILPPRNYNSITPLGHSNNANIMMNSNNIANSNRMTNNIGSNNNVANNNNNNKASSPKIMRCTRAMSSGLVKTTMPKMTRTSKRRQPSESSPLSPNAHDSLNSPTPSDNMPFLQPPNSTSQQSIDDQYVDPVLLQATTSTAAAVAGATASTSATIGSVPEMCYAQSKVDYDRMMQMEENYKSEMLRNNYNLSGDNSQTKKHFLGDDLQEIEVEIASRLPLTSMQDLYEIDEQLQREEFAIAMKCFMAKLRASSMSIDDVFKKVVDDKSIETFNWDGRNGRRSLSSLILFSQIFFDIFYSVDRKEIEKQLRRSIELSHNRTKQRRFNQKKRDFSRIFDNNEMNLI